MTPPIIRDVVVRAVDAPLDPPLLAGPLAVRDGMALVPDRPGTGIVWNEAAVLRHAADV
jgi:L-alanine-DL-glutamate epimerase-like enolase superfamily enzyme